MRHRKPRKPKSVIQFLRIYWDLLGTVLISLVRVGSRWDNRGQGHAGQGPVVAPDPEADDHPKIPEHPSQTGVRGAPSLHRAELPTKPSMRRRATPGSPRRRRRQSSLGQRRRPPRSFSGGAVLSRILKCSPSRKCTERGRAQRPRRPGLEIRVRDSGRVSKQRQMRAPAADPLSAPRPFPHSPPRKKGRHDHHVQSS